MGSGGGAARGPVAGCRARSPRSPMPTPSQPNETKVVRTRLGIRRLRYLILTVMAVSLIGFSGGVVWLVQQIFDNFGPAVRKDLEWQAVRGAQELARGADLGLAVSDSALVTQSLGDFRLFEDVVAIVAVNSAGAVVAAHGRSPESLDALFAGPPGVVRTTPSYLVSWAPATIEGSIVGKIALVISTRRLVESKAYLRQISVGTAVAALLALVCGILFVNFFTGTIAARDAQLAEYASGLESKIVQRTLQLDQRNRAMRLLFDNVEQGVLAVSLDGVMVSERSRIVDRWFGMPAPGARFDDYIRATDPAAAEWFTVGLEALTEGVLPEELLLDQLPREMSRGARTLRLAYTPIAAVEDGTPRQLLVVMTDVTDERARQRMERDSQEMVRIFQRATSDRAGVRQFFAEAGRMVQQVSQPGPLERDRLVVHTLKGNCRQVGLESVADLCHEAESAMEEDQRPLDPAMRERIAARWEHLVGLASFAWDDHRPGIEVVEDDLARLLEALRARVPHHELVGLVEGWRLEPVSTRFARLAEKARYICERLGKPLVTVHVDAGGLRLDSERWAPFWAALVHAVNNALDHGIEDQDARIERGKPLAGTLWLSASREHGDGRSEIVVSVRDDGGGLDWQRLAAQAAAHRLPNATHDELVEAMYVEGISTRATVGAFSGRGVGLTALRQATQALGGRIEVRSETGVGTTMRFRFPCTAELTIAA